MLDEPATLNPTLRARVNQLAYRLRNTHDVEEGVRKALQDFRAPTGIRDPIADPEGAITNPNQFSEQYHASTMILVKDIADILFRKYPGYLWAVQPSDRGQVINVFCLNCHNQYGFVIRMAEIMDDPKRSLAYRAGAEILSRFKMPHKMNPEVIASAPRDMAGNMIPDISDHLSKKRQQEADIAEKLATGKAKIIEKADGKRYLRVDHG